MDINYFQKINNVYDSQSKQEVDLFLLNRHINDHFADSIDYQIVKVNDIDTELIISKYAKTKYKKRIKSRPKHYVNMGDIVDWNGQKWIVTSIDPDDKTYLSADMCLCTILLRWQNKKGDIIERWCFDENLTKYSSGVDESKALVMGDARYGIQLKLDDETKTVKRDKRFVIDEDGVDAPDVYIITNRDVKSANYDYFGRGKIVKWTLSYNAFSSEKDKLITDVDGKKKWICDYISPTPVKPTDNYTMILDYKSTNLYLGGVDKVITALLVDNDGIEVPNTVYEWTVTSNITDDITTSFNDKVFTINVKNNVNIIGELITIKCISKETGQAAEVVLEVKG